MTTGNQIVVSKDLRGKVAYIKYGFDVVVEDIKYQENTSKIVPNYKGGYFLIANIDCRNRRWLFTFNANGSIKCIDIIK